MARRPTITIVTPSYNQAAFLERTITSVLDQKHPGLQYGIVDGGSTDDSRRILDRYRRHVDFVIIEPDRGQSDAINKGLQRAHGDIFAYLNSDDTLLPGSLDTIADHFASQPDSSWLIGACQTIDEHDTPGELLIPRGRFTPEGLLLREGDLEIPQPACFWRRSLHQRVGAFDTSLHYTMDFDLWCRLVCADITPTLIDTPLATYRFHHDSKTVATPERFTQEHLRVEARYRQHLSLRQRLEHMRRMGWCQRRLAVTQHGDDLWKHVLRRPWWLGSQQVREALFKAA